MASGTLFTFPNNFRAYKALIAAQYSGAKVTVPSDFKFGESNKNDKFLAKFPMGKVPAFESSNGKCLFESNAIAYMVGNAKLNGENPESAAEILQWVNFGDNEILPDACTWVFPCLGLVQFNKQETERAKQQIKKALGVLNTVLLTRTYLVGDRISQADISVACNLLLLYQQVLEPEFRKEFQNVNRWFTTLINQKEFKAVIGNVTLCTKMAQFDSKKYNELHGKEKKETGAKKDKKPKEAPKAAKAEKKAEAEDVPALPKEKKDPFADIPKTNFNFDEFKKVYSNEDTVEKAIPYFWQHFDKETMSIWYCEYKEDLSDNQSFMTMNLVAGMFQRLDKLRKNAFGTVLVFGENKKNEVAGIFFWRGQQLAFELSPDWQVDYESYSWKKLDPTTPETKKLVHEYFTFEGDFGGKKVFDGEVFK
ncbi:hypothetical protein LOTGIDRAFT_189800 [Lottia gigantea]|uniref:Elongation factor 1-gamma n=1 Tax=Lottia gigantea TaxID=225164 RepID=V4AA21_LOTGI|nr:hypothetical protein LOTGIDRAFT_189800 [Lottia gigantea]ESO93612.1 hypothetical protein LOTGIDRAFT_189800 [Lottia gigantea]